MNSYREALSRPIGGVGNPSPGNSCQRPQELIGCVWTDLAKLTGTLLRRCESTPAASTLLHCILCSFNLLFIYFDILFLFLHRVIQVTHFFKHKSLFFPQFNSVLVNLQASFGAPHHHFTLVNLREQEKTDNKQVLPWPLRLLPQLEVQHYTIIQIRALSDLND